MRLPQASPAGALPVDPATGMIAGARYLPSPNCDDRPAGCLPELVVVHGISLPPGEFGGPWIERLFTNSLPPFVHPYFATLQDARVSAHALVRRDGSVVQFVPANRRAWHAGESSWCGRSACNDFSIGIELEGTDTTPYEDLQYAVLARLVTGLAAAYPSLRADALTGHADIAPARKTDPGPAFDWPRLRALVEAARHGPQAEGGA